MNESLNTTKVIEDNLNPIFYEAIETNYDMPEPPQQMDIEFDGHNAPPIVLNLYDKDEDLLDLDGDDFLGRAMIKLSEASIVRTMYDSKENCNKIPQPKWHDLKAGFQEHLPACGQVLCSFAIVEQKYKWSGNFSNIKNVDLSGIV